MPSQLASVPLKIRVTSRPNGQCPKSNKFPTMSVPTSVGRVYFVFGLCFPKFMVLHFAG